MKVSRDKKKWALRRNTNGYHAWELAVTVTVRMHYGDGIAWLTPLLKENPSYPKAIELGLGLEFLSFLSIFYVRKHSRRTRKLGLKVNIDQKHFK